MMRYNPSTKNLNKQIHTLHRKLKKKDEVYTTYTIERDETLNQYHIHTLFQYNNKENLYKQLQKYIGGDIVISKGMNGSFDKCFGKYGTLWLEEVKDEKQIYRYINKYGVSKTLV